MATVLDWGVFLLGGCLAGLLWIGAARPPVTAGDRCGRVAAASVAAAPSLTSVKERFRWSRSSRSE